LILILVRRTQRCVNAVSEKVAPQKRAVEIRA
jgi:hypothetical protein